MSLGGSALVAKLGLAPFEPLQNPFDLIAFLPAEPASSSPLLTSPHPTPHSAPTRFALVTNAVESVLSHKENCWAFSCSDTLNALQRPSLRELDSSNSCGRLHWSPVGRAASRSLTPFRKHSFHRKRYPDRFQSLRCSLVIAKQGRLSQQLPLAAPSPHHPPTRQTALSALHPLLC